ncbi:glycosyltransferase family 9 protein [Derxia gummosa]|uniref:Glycosyltransferase family 9 protein n=1 Tax=Derxia gummosa DSM 723 TaxID=1121388 RepID=A0A8B6X8E1_9BURK|nr:glycosyltransferase family 9 protein [Derxia gummosa]
MTAPTMASARVSALAHDLATRRAGNQPVLLLFGLGSFGDILQITPALHALRRRLPRAWIAVVHASAFIDDLMPGLGDADVWLKADSADHAALRDLVRRHDLADLVVQCKYALVYELGRDAARRLSAGELQFVREAQKAQAPWLDFLRDFPRDNDALWRAAAAEGLDMAGLMARTGGFDAGHGVPATPATAPGADFTAYRIAPAPADAADLPALPPRYFTVCNAAEALPWREGGWTKCLPDARMADLAGRLRGLGLPLVQMGTPDDPPIPGCDLDLRGRTGLRSAALVLQGADAHIGPEGGLANLARAVRTPAVIFFGSTPPEFFALGANRNVLPRQCGGCWWTTPDYLHQCPRLQREPECVGSLDLDEIVAAARALRDAAGPGASAPEVRADAIDRLIGAHLQALADGAAPPVVPAALQRALDGDGHGADDDRGGASAADGKDRDDDAATPRAALFAHGPRRLLALAAALPPELAGARRVWLDDGQPGATPDRARHAGDCERAPQLVPPIDAGSLDRAVWLLPAADAATLGRIARALLRGLAPGGKLVAIGAHGAELLVQPGAETRP